MPSALSRLKRIAKVAQYEVKTVMGLATTWPERIEMARFLAMLYVSRIVPGSTYHWTTTVRLRGAKYEVGVRTSEIYIFHEVYDDLMYDRIESYIPQPDWVVVDVGANIGVFSILQAERGANVFAFEPNPECFARLARTASRHKDRSRIRVFETAISDSVGTGHMLVEQGGTTGGTLDDAAANEPTAHTVSMSTLDALAPGLGIEHVDLLKMDIEGAEIDALKGGEKTLAVTDRIVAEYHSKDLLRQFHEILDGAGFEEDLRFVYYPEDLDEQVEEVGMLYASKRNLATGAGAAS